jgi:hypothetical protein
MILKELVAIVAEVILLVVAAVVVVVFGKYSSALRPFICMFHLNTSKGIWIKFGI